MLQLKVWGVAVGEVPLFLLDSACAERPPHHGAALRRRPRRAALQEMVLSIGDVRALRALGLQPTVWHLNKGHAALASLERIRELVVNGLKASAPRWK